jgi:hypothetical protein
VLRDAYVYRELRLREGGGVIVRIAGEGRWLLPSDAEEDVRLRDNAIALAVDDVRDVEYQRLLVELCTYVREHGTRLEGGDAAGDADITVPPPALSLDLTVDALFDGTGLGADQPSA